MKPHGCQELRTILEALEAADEPPLLSTSHTLSCDLCSELLAIALFLHEHAEMFAPGPQQVNGSSGS